MCKGVFSDRLTWFATKIADALMKIMWEVYPVITNQVCFVF